MALLVPYICNLINQKTSQKGIEMVRETEQTQVVRIPDATHQQLKILVAKKGRGAKLIGEVDKAVLQYIKRENKRLDQE